MCVNKRLFILALTIFICAAVFCPKYAFADASVSISGTPTTWELGAKGPSSVSTIGNTWTATNDASNGTETLTIGVTSDGAWTPGATAASNQFVLKLGGSPTYSSGSGVGTDTVITSSTTLVTGLLNNGTAQFGLSFTAPSGGEEGAHNLTVTVTATSWVFICANNLVVAHTAGDTAPVAKTVTYGTLLSNLSGADKCWITQNLGADHQATAVDDSTEASAGWYWQFNRKQGYKHDGTTLTPSWTITSISEDSNWTTANDPCVLLLGTGWRLPTSTEWANADTGWITWTDEWASDLKLHGASYLTAALGDLVLRGLAGYYWSSTQYNPTTGGWGLLFGSGSSSMDNSSKAYGYSARCLRDGLYEEIGCGGTLIKTHTAGDTAPVTKTVTYGTLLSNLSGADKCWITQNLGADHQATAIDDSTEASAGWYWQFNRKQGFKHDGTTLTPSWTITSISEDSNWTTANDPCALLLGTGWRLPTSTEWVNMDILWTTSAECWASVLKLHGAGYLTAAGGALDSRGGEYYGSYSSGTQGGVTSGWHLGFSVSGIVGVYYAGDTKPYGRSVRCLKDRSYEEIGCGGVLIKTHIAGDDTAPVTKTVTYGTLLSNLSGADKCWITQNLGADHQATAIDDLTEASAGWYWQFNRKQGFKMADDGVTRTPSTTWISPISENSNWTIANDPCALLLGTGWRLPIGTEWTSVKSNGAWSAWTDPWNSVLKLHAAGGLDDSDGTLWTGVWGKGSTGAYSCSTQYGTTTGRRNLFFVGPPYNYVFATNQGAYKSEGDSVRCLKD